MNLWDRIRFHDHPVRLFFHRLWDFFTSKTGAFIIGVGAIAIGSYQFYINKPILEYTTKAHTVISSKNVNDLKVTVKEKSYEDLFQTEIILLNSGEQALEGSNVSKIGHDPIRIPLGDAKVVSFTLDKNTTSPAVSAELLLHRDAVIITFDYLNPDNQIGVIILHENPKAEFKVVGSAVNVNQISKAWDDKDILVLILEIVVGIYLISVIVYILRKHFKK